MFGLTTQVPGVDVVAVPGRAPQDRDGVRFVSRSFSRRELGLNPYEAGLLEVLRDFDKVSEEPFDQLVGIVEGAIESGKIRPDAVRDAVAEEWDVATRDRWQRIEALVFEGTFERTVGVRDRCHLEGAPVPRASSHQPDKGPR